MHRSNTCDVPARLRLFVQRRGDDLSASKEFWRWWSNPVAFQLAAGVAELTAALTPDQWVSVFGKRGDSSSGARNGFQQDWHVCEMNLAAFRCTSRSAVRASRGRHAIGRLSRCARYGPCNPRGDKCFRPWQWRAIHVRGNCSCADPGAIKHRSKRDGGRTAPKDCGPL